METGAANIVVIPRRAPPEGPRQRYFCARGRDSGAATQKRSPHAPKPKCGPPPHGGCTDVPILLNGAGHALRGGSRALTEQVGPISIVSDEFFFVLEGAHAAVCSRPSCEKEHRCGQVNLDGILFEFGEFGLMYSFPWGFQIISPDFRCEQKFCCGRSCHMNVSFDQSIHVGRRVHNCHCSKLVNLLSDHEKRRMAN